MTRLVDALLDWLIHPLWLVYRSHKPEGWEGGEVTQGKKTT